MIADMEPDFFAEASAVMNSPYFYARPPESLDGPELVAFHDRCFDERQVLQTALGKCRGYEGLTERAKAIYDRAKASLPEAARGAAAP